MSSASETISGVPQPAGMELAVPALDAEILTAGQTGYEPETGEGQAWKQSTASSSQWRPSPNDDRSEEAGTAVATGPGVTTPPGADTSSDSEESYDSNEEPILDRADLMNRCNECGVRCIKPLSTVDFPAVARAFFNPQICCSLECLDMYCIHKLCTGIDGRHVDPYVSYKYSKGNGQRGIG